jgi:rhamnogalacturonyl hydrolase YesR
MPRKCFIFFQLVLTGSGLWLPQAVSQEAFDRDSVIRKLSRVNAYFLSQAWQRNDRNWIRGTYYTGLMAFYNHTKDPELLEQATNWAAKHAWKIGTEWIHPANRLTCSQTYLELFSLDPGPEKIADTKAFMDRRINRNDHAFKQGWDYVDALYVGIPPFVMMSQATGDPAYALYGQRLFREIYMELYDSEVRLFYRDEKAKKERSKNNKKVFWARGNGWAMASIPRILSYLSPDDTSRHFYESLLQEMAESIASCQGEDGYWRTNLADPKEYPEPESSGTAFFVYALFWGINQRILDETTYFPVAKKGWEALYNGLSPEGMVCWGQPVSRDPGPVSESDSHEFVAGAYLLAGSEILKLIERD